MFVLYALKNKKVITQKITIPATDIAVNALIVDGTPYFHLSAVIQAVTGVTHSIIGNANHALRQVVLESKNSIGAIIVTKRGMFADTNAIRGLVPTFFWDSKRSCEFSLIQRMIKNTRRPRGTFPAIRTVRNTKIYDQLCVLKAPEQAFDKAVKQLIVKDLVRISWFGTERGSFVYTEDISDNVVDEPTPSYEAEDKGKDCVSSNKDSGKKEPASAPEDPIIGEEQYSVNLNNVSFAELFVFIKELVLKREVSFTFSVK